MLAFHQWGFSSGSGDRIPVPAETDQHVSLAILALPDTSSSSSSSLLHGLQLLHCNERGRRLCSCSRGRQVTLHPCYIMKGCRVDPFNYWEFPVGSGYFYHYVRGRDLLQVECKWWSQLSWGSPVLVWGHLDELISLLMVSYRLSQFSLLKQYQPPGHGSPENMNHLSHTVRKRV